MYPLLELLNRLHSAAQRSDCEAFKQPWAELVERYLTDEIDLAKVLNTAHCYTGKVFPPLLVSAIQGGALEIVKCILSNNFECDVKAHYPSESLRA